MKILNRGFMHYNLHCVGVRNKACLSKEDGFQRGNSNYRLRLYDYEVEDAGMKHKIDNLFLPNFLPLHCTPFLSIRRCALALQKITLKKLAGIPSTCRQAWTGENRTWVFSQLFSKKHHFEWKILL